MWVRFLKGCLDKAYFYKNLKILFLWSVGLQNLKKLKAFLE
ncbi:hypothetical protein HPHPH42_1243 [Helicobacter pylori Hp H-42]|uniref:Uncharacterized protein n=1 Tax=Helicobacter pylori Hp H-42 TaxID=992047 RepID=A0AB33XGH9_HELPX|nr:hypothetical protein HPHPH42_1243 [Helicobacter pylori Hp H-42]